MVQYISEESDKYQHVGDQRCLESRWREYVVWSSCWCLPRDRLVIAPATHARPGISPAHADKADNR